MGPDSINVVVLDVTRVDLSVKKMGKRTAVKKVLKKTRLRKKKTKKMILKGHPDLNAMGKVLNVSVPGSIAVVVKIEITKIPLERVTENEEKDVKIANVVQPWKSSTFVKALVVSNELESHEIKI